VWAVPRLCELYPGIWLTTEEKAWKNLSHIVLVIRQRPITLQVFLPFPTTTASSKHAYCTYSIVECKVPSYSGFSCKSLVFAFALHDKVWKGNKYCKVESALAPQLEGNEKNHEKVKPYLQPVSVQILSTIQRKMGASLISADLQAENKTRHLPVQMNRLATMIISRPVRSKTREAAVMK